MPRISRSNSPGSSFRVTRERVVIVGLVAALVFTLAGFGIAAAVIPAPGGVIKSCYVKKTGKLRVLDSAAACKASETALSWNQAGTPGATGAKGATGATGATGITTTQAFGGAIGTIPPLAATFVFAGPTATFAMTTGQRLTGSASGVLGTTSGTAYFDFSLCYSTDGGVTIHPFATGNQYQSAAADSVFKPFATSYSTVINFTGTVIGGFCVRNNTVVPMNQNDYVNGFLQQTN
jgi:hypothetical protein